MNLNFFVQVCGLPLIAITVTLSLALSVAAVFLAVRTKKSMVLEAFTPFCWLPLFSSLGMSLLGFISSLGIQMNSDDGAMIDSGIVLTMNLVPLLFGGLMSVIPFMVASICRWKLVWKTTGAQLFSPRVPAPKEGDQGFDPDAWANQEADDYIDRLVRPR